MPCRIPIYQVDAFTNKRFAGNPAAVVILKDYPDDATLLAIAAENNLPETAFLTTFGDEYRLRWFTPVMEVPLCGHATLASAAVVMEKLSPDRNRVVFHTAGGLLSVIRNQSDYLLDFPARKIQTADAPVLLSRALGVKPIEVVTDGTNYIARLASAEQVRALRPDLSLIAQLERSGVVVTAADTGIYDFVSRFFLPALGIDEDPVTGAIYCALVPYWADRLGKTEFTEWQASARGGEIRCSLAGERVKLVGCCVFYLEGSIEI